MKTTSYRPLKSAIELDGEDFQLAEDTVLGGLLTPEQQRRGRDRCPRPGTGLPSRWDFEAVAHHSGREAQR